jgi:hypothetical protein
MKPANNNKKERWIPLVSDFSAVNWSCTQQPSSRCIHNYIVLNTAAPLFLHANPTLTWHAGSGWLTLTLQERKEEEKTKGWAKGQVMISTCWYFILESQTQQMPASSISVLFSSSGGGCMWMSNIHTDIYLSNIIYLIPSRALRLT